MMAALIAATAAFPGLESSAAFPDIKTTDPFDAFNSSQARIVNLRGVKLERHAVVPLRVCPLEQINLRHGAGNVEKGIDSAKKIESVLDDRLCRLRQAQLDGDDHRLGAQRGNL
jgi:hypothetical protein